MKIRIKENSIRLRLTKSEVEDFLRVGHYNQTCKIGINVLSYTLKSSEEAENLMAVFDKDEITVYMPISYLHQWKAADKVGFTNNVIMEDETSLLLKVEKDFVCLDDTDEDQSDNYPNPRG